MPRSGSSLIERILATHPQCDAIGERGEFTRIVFELMNRPPTSLPMLTDPRVLNVRSIRRIASRYLAVLRGHAAHPDAQCIIDKNPLNFMHVGLMHAVFPNAKFIWTLRDPKDTCISCYLHNFSGQLEFAGDLSSLACVYRQHDRLLGHWQSVLPREPETLLINVKYSDLIRNTEERVRELLAFARLPWCADCLRYHEHPERVTMTASNDQVRQPIYDSSIGRARHYARHLAGLGDDLKGE